MKSRNGTPLMGGTTHRYNAEAERTHSERVSAGALVTDGEASGMNKKGRLISKLLR